MKSASTTRAFLLLGIALSALPGCERSQGSDSQRAVAAAPSADDGVEWARVEFTVQGMDCAGCAIGTRASLKKLDGVKDAGATFGTVEVSGAWAVYDPMRVTPERMMAAIRELGYVPEIAQGVGP